MHYIFISRSINKLYATINSFDLSINRLFSLIAREYNDINSLALIDFHLISHELKYEN